MSENNHTPNNNNPADFSICTDNILQTAYQQMSPTFSADKACAALHYAGAHFAMQLASLSFTNGQDVLQKKQDLLKFYSTQYQNILENVINDWVKHFDNYTLLKDVPENTEV